VSQSRKMSLVEILTKTVITFSSSLLLQMTVFSYLGLDLPLSGNILIVVIFAVHGFMWGFGIRRLFNWIGERRQRVLAQLVKQAQGRGDYD